MKKFLSILTLMVLVFTVSTSTVLAASTTDIYKGVSPIDPGQKISLNEINVPTDVWDVSQKGKYTFGATTYKATKTLYSNYKFIGSDTYLIVVTNDSDYPLTVKLKTTSNTYKSAVVSAHKTRYISAPNVGADKKVYLKFSSSKNLDFDGFIY